MPARIRSLQCSADLLLLDANPLANVANASRRVGVMLRGRWLTNAEIAKRLDAIAAGVNPQTP
jgi:hypothetical protein